jgi:hypothetical protein
VIAGLADIRHGARPDVRGLLIAAAVAVAALAVLAPAGSTDAFDYAAYGRIMALGHSPYVMTPYHLCVLHGPFARSVPVTWQHLVSVYGPLATLEQFGAARLGGLSPALVTFWLKLGNVIAFGLVALIADRLLRADPAGRLRAHLLWTINPLLLWNIVAAGHLDVLAAGAGLLGLVALGQQDAATLPSLPRALASGALVGAAGTISTPLGYPTSPLGHVIGLLHHLSVQVLTPLVLLAAAAGLVALCLTDHWKPRDPPGTTPDPAEDAAADHGLSPTDARRPEDRIRAAQRRQLVGLAAVAGHQQQEAGRSATAARRCTWGGRPASRRAAPVLRGPGRDRRLARTGRRS